MLTLFKDKAAMKRHGDTEYEFIIPVDLVKSTFRYIKPRKVRQYTEAQKQVMAARLKAFRFNSKTHDNDAYKA